MFDTLAPGVLARRTPAWSTTGTLRVVAARVLAAYRRHEAARSLASLDARGLADIGVGPGEIEAVVREGRLRHASHGQVRAAFDAPTLPSSWTEWR